MTRTAEFARGKWRGILLTLGAPAAVLTGKHGPCPFCEGKDRFRWDNKEGGGSFFCSGCGSGDGFEFLKRLKGWDFAATAREVDAVVGNVKAEQPKAKMDASQRRDMLNRLWLAGTRINEQSPVAAYLAGRELPMPQSVDCLRFVERCPVPHDGGFLPAMVALVSGPDGKPVSLHRTFLGPNGKASIEQPRAIMPGDVPEGSAIRLAMHGARLGIAEGIETALAATLRFGVPVWAAINSTMMSKWQVPDGVSEVWIFGDNDPKFGGAAAAYALAHRLATRDKVKVEVVIPRQVGLDWADMEAAA